MNPWLVLVVGLEGSELTLTGDQVRIEVAAQQDPQALGGVGVDLPIRARAAGRCWASRRAGAVRPAAAARHRVPGGGRPRLRRVRCAVMDGGRGGDRAGVRRLAVQHRRTARQLRSARGTAGSRPGTGRRLRAALHYPRLAGAPELGVLGALVAPPATWGT